jgi:hypothetical protein
MLEKAKNQKIFLFFVIILLGICLFVSPVIADDYTANWGFTHSGTWSSAFSWNLLVINKNDYPNVHSITLTQIAGNRAFYWQSSGTTGNSQPMTITTKSGYFVANCTGYTTGGVVTLNCTNWTTASMSDYEYLLLSGDTLKTVTTGKLYLYYLLPNSASKFQLRRADSLSYTYGNVRVDVSYGTIYEAGITASDTSGESPFYVTFTDSSSGFPETYPYPTYEIDFGDGYSASGERQYTGENWYHVYQTEKESQEYNVTYTVTYDGEEYIDTETITVAGNTDNFYVAVAGLNTTPIVGANVSIWYNGAYQDSKGTSEVWGRAYFTVPENRLVTGTVTHPGYKNASFSQYVGTTNTWKVVTLYLEDEEEGSGDSYGNYLVTFKNVVTGESVSYSNIKVYSDSGYTSLFYDEYSDVNGVWTGLMPMNVTYYYKYPETTGYYSQSWSYNLTSSPAYKTVNLVPKSGATTTVTPTPTSIITTITPTPTYTLSEDEISSLNVKARMTNLLVLAGFQNAESADLIFAMIIVLGCTALIGWITLSGSGAGMGAIIGFVFSLGLGLIPLWLLIAAIFFGCLYVALKLFGGSGE